MRGALGLIAAVAAGCALAQQPQHTEGARELFYFGATEKDQLPPIHKVSAPAKGSKTTQSASVTPQRPAAGPSTTGPSSGAGALHLGLRYNLVLVNEASGESEPVDSDRVFHKGECIAIDIAANRSGYLYVLARESSGGWHLLIPSPEMSEESTVLDPGRKIRAPQGYCFGIADPPGTETLFVVLSRDPRDFLQLYDAVKGSKPAPNAPQPQPAAVEVADARIVDSAVAQMAKQFGTRDLVIRKVAQPAAAQETRNSVYVVNASDKPSSTVVTEILVHHR